MEDNIHLGMVDIKDMIRFNILVPRNVCRMDVHTDSWPMVAHSDISCLVAVARLNTGLNSSTVSGFRNN